MSDDELCEWRPEALVGLIRRLEEQLAVATARIAELEAELARRGGAPKTPQNSSTPPSKGWERDRAASEGGKHRPAVRAGGNEPAAGRDGLGGAVPADPLRAVRARL